MPQKKIIKKDTIESINDFSSSMVKNTANEFKKIGTGIFDQFFGNNDENNDFNEMPRAQEQKPNKPQLRRESVFTYSNYYETEIVKREIKNLTEQVRREIEHLKNTEKNLLNEVQDISKLTVESLPEKPGIYHIRFLELVLSILRTLRLKINESRTWMQAMVSKRKKRGSLFATRSKKMGTQYSMSQELSNARSIQ